MHIMKKTILLGITIFIMGVFVFTSCSSDDSSNDELHVDKAHLVGMWINTRTDWNEDGERYYETYSDSKRYLNLNSDGTGYVSPPYLFEAVRSTFNWSISKNKLTIIEEDGDIVGFIVVKLNNNELVLRWEDYFDDSCYFIETSTFKKNICNTNK